MSVDPKSLHPSVLEAVADFRRRPYPTMTNQPEAMAAWHQHQTVQFRRNGARMLILLAAFVGIIVGSVVATDAAGWSEAFQILSFFFVFILGGIGVGKAISFLGRVVTTEHVRVLAPGLIVDETQRGYIDSVLAIDASPHYSQNEGQEILSGLNSLLDQDRHLAELSAELGSVRAEQIRTERDKLLADIDSATDTDAKRAYQQSIELLESRLAAATIRETARQRVESQRALVRQAVLSIRDSLVGSGSKMSVLAATDLSTLKLTIDTVRTQAQSVESAIEEVRALAR